MEILKIAGTAVLGGALACGIRFVSQLVTHTNSNTHLEVHALRTPLRQRTMNFVVFPGASEILGALERFNLTDFTSDVNVFTDLVSALDLLFRVISILENNGLEAKDKEGELRKLLSIQVWSKQQFVVAYDCWKKYRLDVETSLGMLHKVKLKELFLITMGECKSIITGTLDRILNLCAVHARKVHEELTQEREQRLAEAQRLKETLALEAKKRQEERAQLEKLVAQETESKRQKEESKIGSAGARMQAPAPEPERSSVVELEEPEEEQDEEEDDEEEEDEEVQDAEEEEEEGKRSEEEGDDPENSHEAEKEDDIEETKDGTIPGDKRKRKEPNTESDEPEEEEAEPEATEHGAGDKDAEIVSF